MWAGAGAGWATVPSEWAGEPGALSATADRLAEARGGGRASSAALCRTAGGTGGRYSCWYSCSTGGYRLAGSPSSRGRGTPAGGGAPVLRDSSEFRRRSNSGFNSEVEPETRGDVLLVITEKQGELG